MRPSRPEVAAPGIGLRAIGPSANQRRRRGASLRSVRVFGVPLQVALGMFLAVLMAILVPLLLSR